MTRDAVNVHLHHYEKREKKAMLFASSISKFLHNFCSLHGCYITKSKSCIIENNSKGHQTAPQSIAKRSEKPTQFAKYCQWRHSSYFCVVVFGVIKGHLWRSLLSEILVAFVARK